MESRLALLTGKLAEKPLRRIAADIPSAEVIPLNISVAAFMTTDFILKSFTPSSDISRIIISGKCKNVDISKLCDAWKKDVIKGPEDLKDIPIFLFGKEKKERNLLQDYDIKIFAEIVDAPLLQVEDVLKIADYYASNGADIIDLGCVPGLVYKDVELVVKLLKERGFKVSIDTFDVKTIKRADKAGVDFVLSINSSNIDIATDLQATLVVVPDFGELGMDSLRNNVEKLRGLVDNSRLIIDPVISPFGVGFTESILRYQEASKIFPENDMLMGIGNLTELTDADSVGLNMALVNICQELGVRYVLTTEVISWAKGSVKEIDIARKISYLSNREKLPPKNISDQLVVLKDPPFQRYSMEELIEMQKGVKDRNWRIFLTNDDRICVFNRDKFIVNTDIDSIFSEMEIVKPSHAFYIGKELYKARIALLLGKKYEQDSDLRWGYLSEKG